MIQCQKEAKSQVGLFVASTKYSMTTSRQQNHECDTEKYQKEYKNRQKKDGGEGSQLKACTSHNMQQ